MTPPVTQPDTSPAPPVTRKSRSLRTLHTRAPTRTSPVSLACSRLWVEHSRSSVAARQRSNPEPRRSRADRPRGIHRPRNLSETQCVSSMVMIAFHQHSE